MLKNSSKKFLDPDVDDFHDLISFPESQ